MIGTHFLRLTFRFFLLLCISWTSECRAAPHDGGQSAEPRCAFVVFNPSATARLTEARLQECGHSTWLERNEIDRILSEQKLATCFAAESPRSRVSLGQLLRADLLVLMRSNEKRIDLVVAETTGGLRILAHSIPESNDAEADAGRLVSLVAQAMAKYREAIREVYAVPPFLSRDLGAHDNHLMSAYAALAERILLAQPGVLVVEITEAESIAREYAMTSPGEHIQRRRPIYLLGEYRHDGRDQSRQIRLSLETKRGDAVLNRTSHTMRSDEAIEYLSRAIVGLSSSQGRAATAFNSVAESELLARRSQEFVQLRDWPQALSLAEASLLLNTDQVDVHMCAIAALRELTRSLGSISSLNESQVLPLRRRKLDHLKRALATKGPDRVPLNTIQANVGYRRHDPDPLPRLPAGFRGQLEIERDYALQMAYYYADRGVWDMSRVFSATKRPQLPERYGLRHIHEQRRGNRTLLAKARHTLPLDEPSSPPASPNRAGKPP